MLEINWIGRLDRLEEAFCEKVKNTLLSHIEKTFERKLSFSVSIEICDEVKIRELNREYRKKDKATDVLSFPIFESLKSETGQLVGINEVEFGDIIICEEVCESQAIQHSIDFNSELIHLIIHGYLHLIGYDHELSQKDDELMKKEEERVLNIYELS